MTSTHPFGLTSLEGHMIKVEINQDAIRITRYPGRELLHSLAWLGLVPASLVAGKIGPILAMLGMVPLVLLIPAIAGVLRTRRVLLDAESRQAQFISIFGHCQAGLTLAFDSIREIVLQEVTDADGPLFQVLLSCDGGTSELTAGGVQDERFALELGNAVQTWLRNAGGAGVRHVTTRRSMGKALDLHVRNRT